MFVCFSGRFLESCSILIYIFCNRMCLCVLSVWVGSSSRLLLTRRVVIGANEEQGDPHRGGDPWCVNNMPRHRCSPDRAGCPPFYPLYAPTEALRHIEVCPPGPNKLFLAPPSSLGSSSHCEGGAGKQGLGYPSLKVSCTDRAAFLSPRSYLPKAPCLVARQPEGLRG